MYIWAVLDAVVPRFIVKFGNESDTHIRIMKALTND